MSSRQQTVWTCDVCGTEATTDAEGSAQREPDDWSTVWFPRPDLGGAERHVCAHCRRQLGIFFHEVPA